MLLVVDGTGMLHFAECHCEPCLSHRLSSGERVSSHPVVEAKIVCANGLVVSLGSDLLANDEGADHQDWELKAFSRLAAQIRRDFPHLRVCLVADGLYAGEATFRLCKAYGWAYVIVSLQGDLPTVWEQVEGLKPGDAAQPTKSPGGLARWRDRAGTGLVDHGSRSSRLPRSGAEVRRDHQGRETEPLGTDH